MLPEYSTIFDSLDEKGIRFCLLRDEMREEKLLKDIDILIEDERFDHAVNILGKMGYKIKNTGRLNPYKVVLIKYDKGNFTILDLHRRLVYQGMIYLDHQNVLERREKTENYYLPSKTDFLLILVFHNVLGKGKIQNKHYQQIKGLMCGYDKEYAESALRSFGTAKTFFRILDEFNNLKTDQARVLKLRENIIRSIYVNNPISFVKVGLLKIKKLRFSLSLKRRGILIAFLGVDGAGKSSLAEALNEIFNQHPVFQTSVEYMGPWGHYKLALPRKFLYRPGSLFTVDKFKKKWSQRNHTGNFSISDILSIGYKRFTGKNLSEEEEALHKIIRENSRFYLILKYISSSATPMLFFLSIMPEMYFRYLKIYRKLRRGKIIIADRYVYDLMVGSMHETVNHYEGIRSFMCDIFFKPDIVFLLHDKTERILLRKNQLTAGNLEAIQAIYDEIAAKYGFIYVLTDQESHVLAQRLIEKHFDKIIDSIRI